jgi:hypothetical protein
MAVVTRLDIRSEYRHETFWGGTALLDDPFAFEVPARSHEGRKEKEMNTEQTAQPALHINQEKLLALVRTMIGGTRGREDDDHPLPPGPWDPVIRVALQSLAVGPQPVPWRTLGPSPEPWKVIAASILATRPGAEVELNPQPEPPGVAFLVSVAKSVISRAAFLQEIADASAGANEQRGTIDVGAYISRFVDDWCGNGFRLRYPFPGPRPHWFVNELGGIDLLVMAAQFAQEATETFSAALRQHFSDASTEFVKAGIAKMG